MEYINTVKFIMDILFMLYGMMLMHFFVFAVIGVFCKKRYPKSETKLKYGLIIPARNEEAVISGLIESIQKNNYPQDKLQIFVVAHNCTDKTAEIAKDLGATVYEYNNPEENTMGYAFRYLFSCIERDYRTSSFDGFFIFNADNLLDKNYISYMNDAFVYNEKKCVITSFRNSKNFGSCLVSGLCGMYFMVGCRLESRGRTFAGCSTRVQGTGYLINSDIVKDGWRYVSLAEDWEFTADRILMSNKIRYCDEAVFYDEQPTSIRIMWRQRVRWSRGHLIVFYTRIKDLIEGIFSPKTKNRGSLYDITVNVLPVTIIFLVLSIIQTVLLLFSPLIDKGASLKDIFLSAGSLFIWLRSLLLSYFTTFLSCVIMFIIERKRIKNVSITKKVFISLLWPFFMVIQFVIDLQAFFLTDLEWKPVPHSDQTSFEHVN